MCCSYYPQCLFIPNANDNPGRGKKPKPWIPEWDAGVLFKYARLNNKFPGQLRIFPLKITDLQYPSIWYNTKLTDFTTGLLDLTLSPLSDSEHLCEQAGEGPLWATFVMPCKATHRQMPADPWVKPPAQGVAQNSFIHTRDFPWNLPKHTACQSCGVRRMVPPIHMKRLGKHLHHHQ